MGITARRSLRKELGKRQGSSRPKPVTTKQKKAFEEQQKKLRKIGGKKALTLDSSSGRIVPKQDTRSSSLNGFGTSSTLVSASPIIEPRTNPSLSPTITKLGGFTTLTPANKADSFETIARLRNPIRPTSGLGLSGFLGFEVGRILGIPTSIRNQVKAEDSAEFALRESEARLENARSEEILRASTEEEAGAIVRRMRAEEEARVATDEAKTGFFEKLLGFQSQSESLQRERESIERATEQQKLLLEAQETAKAEGLQERPSFGDVLRGGVTSFGKTDSIFSSKNLLIFGAIGAGAYLLGSKRKAR